MISKIIPKKVIIRHKKELVKEEISPIYEIEGKYYYIDFLENSMYGPFKAITDLVEWYRERLIKIRKYTIQILEKMIKECEVDKYKAYEDIMKITKSIKLLDDTKWEIEVCE